MVLTSYGLLLDPGAQLTWQDILEQDSTQLEQLRPLGHHPQVRIVSGPHALLKEYSPPSVAG